jgi:hypothetical protein
MKFKAIIENYVPLLRPFRLLPRPVVHLIHAGKVSISALTMFILFRFIQCKRGFSVPNQRSMEERQGVKTYYEKHEGYTYKFTDMIYKQLLQSNLLSNLTGSALGIILAIIHSTALKVVTELLSIDF